MAGCELDRCPRKCGIEDGFRAEVVHVDSQEGEKGIHCREGVVIESVHTRWSHLGDRQNSVLGCSGLLWVVCWIDGDVLMVRDPRQAEVEEGVFELQVAKRRCLLSLPVGVRKMQERGGVVGQR